MRQLRSDTLLEVEPGPAVTLRERARRYSPAQRRTISAALELFADRGVGGTSLQMIADSLGVTKAAVYHQFKTKESIMLAVAEVELERLEEALDAAEAEGTSLAAREALLSKVIDVVLERRRALSTLQHDPVLVRLLGEHEPFRRLWVRLFTVLLGGETGAPARVRARGPLGRDRWCGRPPVRPGPRQRDPQGGAAAGHPAAHPPAGLNRRRFTEPAPLHAGASRAGRGGTRDGRH